MEPTIWAFLLLVLALAFMFMELFIPSGGLLGFLAAGSLVASVAIVFVQVGVMAAVWYLAALTIVIPFTIIGLIHWWPHTPVGRRVLNLPPGRAREIAGVADYQSWQAFLGKRGIAKSMMLPSGVVEIDHQVLDATSEGGAIDRGDLVEVVKTEGRHLIVRKLEIVSQPTEDTELPASSDSLIEDPFA